MRDLALRYVGRYATSRHRLIDYLRRKLRERGWGEAGTPDPEGLAARFVDLGYIDDREFARTRADGLMRRGYGPNRVEQALRAAGIEEADREAVKPDDESETIRAAVRFAERKRIGPFASQPADRDIRQKQLQAMIRAGHGFGVAKSLVFADSLDDIDLLDVGAHVIEPDDGQERF